MLPASGDDVDGGGLVFVSYSHVDVAWAQRFRVLLKPLVRRKHLQLWDDTQIRVGDEWHPAIGEAIGRSRVALLLVSADFLASDYIAEREMPALLDRGVMLAPVLVSDCFWSAIPELAAVQWLHDPGRDGPLGLHAGNPAERDRRIHRACERLLTVTPEPALAEAAAAPAVPPPPVLVPAPSRRPPDPAGPPPSFGRRDAPPDREPGPVRLGGPAVADVPEGDVAGALSRVPALPLHYVVRDELDGLVDAVVGTAAGGAVGLTGKPVDVGLHGIGGIGKSVLAAALAADERICRRFPDGVHWVTVGERPDVLALQLDLLSRLGARPEVRTRADAAQALRATLGEKQVLLVVDDVWASDDARDLRVTGPRGRVLYTSRDQAVVDAAGAAAHRVWVLSPAAARTLAGEVLGAPAAALPAAADRAFAAVGHVPLAVALLAAAVRGRQEWELVAAEPGSDGRGAVPGAWEETAANLARDADVYGTHPYATTFRALNIAVAALPDDLRAALLGLAVFPPDTAIPVAAIARYWAHTRSRSAAETVADLDRLLAAEVLQPGANADTIGFHDLAHEYLLLHADALPELHKQLLDAYRVLLDGPEEWWTLPLDEPYIWEHLALHLATAGARSTLTATVTDPAYQARRIARDGPQAGEADLAVTARVVPDALVVAWWRAWLARHAHLLSGASPRVAATMSAWLESDPARPVAVRPGRLGPLLPRPYLAVRTGLRSESRALIRVLTGHAGRVNAVAWSPDAACLATAGSDGTVRISSPDTGETLTRLTAHDDVFAVAWSPDGRLLATAGFDRTARIWDPTTGQAVTRLVAHGWVRSVAWSPDGTRLAYAGDDSDTRIWDLATGHTLKRLTGRTGRVWAVEWSPDGGRLALVVNYFHSGTVRIWDPITGQALHHLSGHERGVRAVAWSPDGTRLATAGDDGTARIWDPTTAHCLQQLTGNGHRVQAVAWSPDGTHLATAGDDGTARIWDPTSGRTLHHFNGHTLGLRAVAWSPDSTRLATAGDDRTTRIWNLAKDIRTADGADQDPTIGTMAWSPDGTLLATTGDDDATVLTWKASTGRIVNRLTGDGRVSAVAWSPDGTHLATAGNDHGSRLWNVRTGRALRKLTAQWGWIQAVAWAPDGTLLATIEGEHTVRLWTVASSRWLGGRVARIVGTFTGHRDRIRAIAWSPDGTRLATAGRDHTVGLWDRHVGAVVRTFPGHTAAVDAVAWSPDGTELASTGDDRTLRLWDPVSGRPITLGKTDHRGAVHSVAWSPDGTHLATADSSGLVIIWDRDMREVTSLQCQPSECLVWGPSLLAVGQPGRPAILELRDPADIEDSTPLN